jgi:alpha-N-acetylglucosaminidase
MRVSISGTASLLFLLFGLVPTAHALPDPVTAAEKLAARLLGDRAREFEFAAIAPEDGNDVFEVEAANGKALVKGSSAAAMASGLNWYLKYGCNASVSWCGNQLDLPKPLPPVERLRKVSPYKYRYYFNYCTFSYTMAWWDWDRWEREIDWMALNGINMPLSITGQEAIWQAVYRDLGLSDDEINGFFVGPAYLPFGWMGCMDGWGGPLFQGWIEEHRKLEKQIVARERELGMTPVLQGFTGHAPAALKTKFPEARLLQTSSWCEFPPTCFIDPADPLFVKIGKAFIEEQTRQYGADHLYAADTFIEMSPPSNDPAFLDRMGKAVYEAMAAADPQAVWVMQGWIFVNNPGFWKPPQARALLGAVPDDRMILLDLFCEVKPTWSSTEAFYGKPWVWCIVHDFGGTLNMQGRLAVIAQGPPAALASPRRGRLSGIGLMMEGIEQNPIVYDLMTEMAWRTEAPDLDPWVKDYARRRYGRTHEKAEQAWKILQETVYSVGGAPMPAICARPSRAPGGAPLYDPHKLVSAWETLLDCAGDLGAKDTYRYDLVNVARQALANLSGYLCADLIDAYKAKDAERLDKAARSFPGLIRDLDSLLGSRREFLLGRWLVDAKKWGKTEQEIRHCEWNARNQITLWGPRSSGLHEYAHKEWAGLVSGFYLRRWEMFVDTLRESLTTGAAFDAKAFEDRVTAWEESWTHENTPYPDEPAGNPIEMARSLLAKYRPVFDEIGKPDVVSLTTGKPASCSAALPEYPARLANDGRARDANQYWATDVTSDPAAWWQVDLEKPTTVGRVVVVCYYGDTRYYGFTIETSLDGKHWEMAADRRDNKEPSPREGYTCTFAPRLTRCIRITQTHNSANTGRHLVEVVAFER